MTNQTQRKIKWFSLVRVVGLLLVLGYHFWPQRVSGGFIGVDVFFTFSGFLITSLMIDEFLGTGTFQLGAFIRRRFYRIVPPLVMSVLLVVPLTWLVTPDLIVDLGRQVAAAVGFVTNYFEIATGGSYEAAFIPHLFVHTWSLAVEMHFYLVWGLLGWGIARLVRRRPGGAQTDNFRTCLFLAALILTGASLVTLWFGQQGLGDFSPVYFNSLTHSFPFFIGALAGTLSGISWVWAGFATWLTRTPAWVAILVMALAALGLGGLGLTLQFSAPRTYQWGLLAASGLAVLMILGARTLDERMRSRQEPRILTFLADTSYSMYLYHWPLFVIFARLMPMGSAIVLTIALGLLLASLAYYGVEPVVAGRHGRLFGRPIGGKWLGVPLTVATIGLIGLTGWRISEAPAMTSLASTLWTEDLYQDVETVAKAANRALPATSAAQPAAEAPAGDETDYQAANRHSTAAKHNIPQGVSIIGDSVVLGIRRALTESIANSEVDAAGDRRLDQTVDLITAAQTTNTLREFVVIGVGTNSLDNYAEKLQALIDGLAPGHKLILITPYNRDAKPNWFSSKLGVLELTLPAQYDWVTIADWAKVAAAHPELFAGTDGVHFPGRAQGEQLYAETINQALMTAAGRPAKP